MRVIEDKEKTPSLAELVNQAKREPVIVRTNQGEEAVVVSRATYDFLTGDRQRRIENFLKARDALAEEAARNGLTEEKLAEILK
jgi:PHD/YefM family antitoxin component YafN of YafNO toxin-antitoxin module